LTVDLGLGRDFGVRDDQERGLESAELELFADYHQIHLSDDGSMTDLSEVWTDQAVADHLAVAEDAMAVGTSVNVTVAVTVEVLDAPPADDLTDFDHVVEGSLQIPSG
jgi:hypothetical protein